MKEFMVQENVNRFHDDLPRIGIRPIIDGRRRGVRESLEKQTMAMAKAAAKLISSNLRYPNGMPVECVIGKTTIACAAEAAEVARQFKAKNVTATLSVTPCWCYGSETMDMDPLTQKAVWGFNGTERPGAVYLAAVLAAHAQKGLPAFGIYGHDVQAATDSSIPADVEEKILRFARGAVAVGMMRGKSYLSIGSVAMGIAGSTVDPNFFEDYLNMRCVSVDMTEIIRRVNENIYDEAEFKKAYAWATKYCKQYKDVYNGKNGFSAAVHKEKWQYCVKMAMIARDLLVGNPRLAELGFVEESNGNNAILGGFQGQRQWTDHMPNGDFMETILNTSFDWNGIREAYVLATENDCLNGVAMLFSHLLSCRAAGFSDVRTYWSPAAVKTATGTALKDFPGMIHLINSGATTLDATGRCSYDGAPAMKHFWEITEAEAKACLAATEWAPANLGYFRGGGYSSRFLTRGGMPVTMSRVNLVKGLGPVLQLAEGYTFEPPKKVHDILDSRTDPGWPSTWFIPRTTGCGAFKDVYSVMANWGANHGAFTYGHIGADLITLASMMRIPVCMHNVDAD
ncbi:MAG: L-fucose isomerase, partial [Victivallaceae bacterium]|nr:L-fucose isomerase [Victivallaceae bacterium]